VRLTISARNSDQGDDIDSETENWPVPSVVKPFLDEIKPKFQAFPLAVYRADDTFVEPIDVCESMRNAIVEVHFALKHYRIGKGDSAFDSFSATVEQVVILKGGDLHSGPSYSKRSRDIRQGPFRPQFGPTLNAGPNSVGGSESSSASTVEDNDTLASKGKQRDRSDCTTEAAVGAS
jgi:hypothetical protein